MAEILHFEILRKHGQTDRQTDMGITIPRPPPMGGEVMTDNALVSSARAEGITKHTDNITSMSDGNMKLIYTCPGIYCMCYASVIWSDRRQKYHIIIPGYYVAVG